MPQQLGPLPKQLLGPNNVGFSSAQIAAPYQQYDVVVEYVYRSGKIQMPVAGNDDGTEEKCVIIQAHSPIGQRVVTFTLKRYGCACVAPDATPNEGETLMSAIVKVVPPKPSDDANAGEWKMSGVYVFALDTPGANLSQTQTLTTG